MLTQILKVLFVSMIFTERISELREDLGYNYTLLNGLNINIPQGNSRRHLSGLRKQYPQISCFGLQTGSPKRATDAGNGFPTDLS